MDEHDFWDLVFACSIAGGVSVKSAERMADEAVVMRRKRTQIPRELEILG